MKPYLFVLFIAIVIIFTQCGTLKTLPTHTSGGIFSLNGSWRLTASSDHQALLSTVVQVFPGVADATITTLGNNNYCLRERDVLWRHVKAYQGGTFHLETLINACNGTPVYKPATLTTVSNDEIKITGHTVNHTTLTQTWQRVRNQ